MKYYQEIFSTDYLCIDEKTKDYYLSLGEDVFEGRSTALRNNISSVCTGAISRSFLKENCKRVKKSDVPKEWLERFELTNLIKTVSLKRGSRPINSA